MSNIHRIDSFLLEMLQVSMSSMALRMLSLYGASLIDTVLERQNLSTGDCQSSLLD